MDTSLYTIETTSPKDLREQLSRLNAANKLPSGEVILAINGEEIVVTPYRLEGLSEKDMLARLQNEAVEILSLPVNDIRLEMQTLFTHEGVKSGVFSCVPKTFIRDCLDMCAEFGIKVAKIQPLILTHMNAFFRQFGVVDGRFCILDFTSPGKVNLAIFNREECEIIRKIPYDMMDEVKREIIQSIRCASASSRVKELDYIYYTGNPPQKEALIQELKDAFSAKDLKEYQCDHGGSLTEKPLFFKMDFVKSVAFTVQQRQTALLGAQCVLLFAFLLCGWLGYRIMTVSGQVAKLEQSFQEKDYVYAMNLKKQLDDVRSN